VAFAEKPKHQGWARDVKARDRDETFVALETWSRR